MEEAGEMSPFSREFTTFSPRQDELLVLFRVHMNPFTTCYLKVTTPMEQEFND